MSVRSRLPCAKAGQILRGRTAQGKRVNWAAAEESSYSYADLLYVMYSTPALRHCGSETCRYPAWGISYLPYQALNPHPIRACHNVAAPTYGRNPACSFIFCINPGLVDLRDPS